jgi:hypothetical protein
MPLECSSSCHPALYREWIKRWGHIFLTAEIAELAEKIRGILSVLCGLSGEMVRKAHEHIHSPLYL